MFSSKRPLAWLLLLALGCSVAYAQSQTVRSYLYGQVDETSTVSAAEGQYRPVRITPTGEVYTTTSGGGGGSSDTELPAAAALADGAANPTTPTVGADQLLWNGTTWDRQPGTAALGAKTNVGSLAGTAIDTNSGTKSAGTQRVVIATDQPALTNAQPANTTQLGGNSINTGTGAASTGTARVAVASDTTWQPVLGAGTADAGRMLCGKSDIITREVTILDADNAQTNASLVGTINTGTCVELYGIDAMASGANTGTSGISVRVGFGASAVPTAALAGVNGVVLSHLGLMPGSGISKGTGCSLIGVGASGEELRATTADPVGGGLTIDFSYRTISC